MAKWWFSSDTAIFKVIQWCKQTQTLLFIVFKKVAYSLSIIAFSIGGAIVGTVVGAIKGQTTETGFLHGGAVGAITGAITAIELMELIQNGESFSKVALLHSILDGKVFVEWVTPAVLKAYHWQINSMGMLGDGDGVDGSELYEISNGKQGLAKDSIEKLTQFNISISCHNVGCCSICLENLKDGDVARILPSCLHLFHLQCIDQWLIRQGSCPVCRHVII
ncbi:NEP1-interacting protein 2 [Impatiens glandulifera]|uniref:NEP1-interacting protein 2 n=1 Tax=Impatiens glandulifera TaxID=253017 RepID=UPI001FB084CA|nr:NEP1-interacting protein 2 [Impatiens glandulifera]